MIARLNKPGILPYMEESRFRVVGEPAKKLALENYALIAAEATDTRLMGVVGMHLGWQLRDIADIHDESAKKALSLLLGESNIVTEFHQFYYYEAEENGLESLSEIWSGDPREIRLAKDRNFGGLGGNLMPLSEREACYLIGLFVNMSRKRSTASADALAELSAYASGAAPFTEEEIADVNFKICEHPKTDYGAVHYYLMRMAGCDEDGARLLVSRHADPSNIKLGCPSQRAVMRRNSAERYVDENGRVTYLCETLLDRESGFYLAFSEIELSDREVIFSELKNEFKISFREAEQKLRRPEYISFYEIKSDDESFDDEFAALIPKASRKWYENGLLFMEYNKDNSHVEQPLFTLSDDLKASYFLTEASQLVVASYSSSGILSAENMLHASPISGRLAPMGRYSFSHPLLGDFIDSGYDDFVEYLRGII